jgi:hypothetical protein
MGAAFVICGDESGKLGKNTDFTSFCGYIAHISEWQRLDLEWNNARLRFQCPPIHMSRIMAPDQKDDEWKATKNKWGMDWEARRDLMLQDFAKTVLAAQVICIGAVVDAAHFRHLCDIDPKFKARFKDPIYMAFHTFVMRGIEKTEIIDKCSPITLFLDDDKQFAMGCYDYIWQLKSDFPKARERVHGVAFVNDASYPGVQAADMIAYESRRLMVERKAKPDTPMSDRYMDLTLYAIHQPHYYNAAVLDELRAGMPDDKS